MVQLVVQERSDQVLFLGGGGIRLPTLTPTPRLLARRIPHLKNLDRNPPHFSRFRQKYLEPRKDDIIYNIPHHGFSQLTDEENLPRIPEEREDWLQRLEKRPYNIDISLGTIYLDSLFSTASDPDVSLLETWEAWVASMQFHYTVFMLATHQPGTNLEILIDHKVRHLKAVGPMYCANASNWATAFFLTTICRSEEKRRELCEIPVDFIKKAGESDGAQYNPFTYHWISALQALILNRPGLGENLLAAMELSDPDRVDFGDADILNKITFPQMNTFLRHVEGDKDKFNEALAQGLTLFHEYQTSSEEHASDIEGIVPLGLLARACIAYDNSRHDPDFALEVESGYLPKHLLQGSWHGEFPI